MNHDTFYQAADNTTNSFFPIKQYQLLMYELEIIKRFNPPNYAIHAVDTIWQHNIPWSLSHCHPMIQTSLKVFINQASIEHARTHTYI